MLRRYFFSITGSAVIFLCLALIAPSLRSVFVGNVSAEDEDLWQNYEDYEVIDSDTTWTGSFRQTDLTKPVAVVNGATLTIEKGTKVEIGELKVFSGRIDAQGTDSEPVIFVPAPSYIKLPPNGAGEYDEECYRVFPPGTIGFFGYQEENDEASILRNVIFDGMGSDRKPYAGHCPSYAVDTGGFRSWLGHMAIAAEDEAFIAPAIEYRNGKLLIEHSVFRNNVAYAGVRVSMWFSDEWDSTDLIRIKDSDFEGDSDKTALVSLIEYDGEADYSGRISLENDWFGSSSGPSGDRYPQGGGERISGPHRLDGFNRGRNVQERSGMVSNVLFLPGIKASRLYTRSGSGEDQLWPPTLFGNDLDDLVLNSDGHSVHDVYTDDVLASVGPDRYYESFLSDLQGMQDDGTITGFVPFAYDWRMDVEDVVSESTPYREGEQRLLDRTRELADISKTGKVTIVAHSNGGLVAKALVKQLEEQGDAGIVDRMILVGTPQMGTPISILSLLYGYDESILGGLLATRSDARVLAENMPGAYGLLPSSEYFDRTRQSLVRFDSERTRYADYLHSYGKEIGSRGELESFLSGAEDGRNKPDPNDVEAENVLNGGLLDRSQAMHDDLDSWTPPAGVEVIQIAGWGLDTVRGVRYAEEYESVCRPVSNGKIPSCWKSERATPVYEPEFTVDGDAVVTTPSALLMSDSDGNVKRYWADLVGSKNEHGQLFELISVRDFIDQLIRRNEDDTFLPDRILQEAPWTGSKRIRVSLHSPLDISLEDAEGNHTGPVGAPIIGADGARYSDVEVGIPGSTYLDLGGRKYLSFPAGYPVKIHLSGYAEGAYTLRLDEVDEASDGTETVHSNVTFESLPVGLETAVELSVPAEGLKELSALRADYDTTSAGGEYIVEPILDGSATLPPDGASPISTASVSGKAGKNGWYVGSVSVALSADDGADGSGVDRIEYVLGDAAEWNKYAGPFSVDREGATSIRFRATDIAGNVENERYIEVRIDKVAPEARIGFDASVGGVAVSGVDAVSDAVSVETTEKPVFRKKGMVRVSALIRDEAGHETSVSFDRTDRVGSSDIGSLSVTYDGSPSSVVSCSARYDWFLGPVRNRYVFLTSELQSGSQRLASSYLPLVDRTLLIRYPIPGNRGAGYPSVEWMPGLIFPKLETEKGKANVIY